MRKTRHKTDRHGDKVTIQARWLDELKRPAEVAVNVKRGDLVPDDGNDAVLISGDIREVDGILTAIADIAWERGWRPRGLMGKLVHTIESYVLPPDAR